MYTRVYIYIYPACIHVCKYVYPAYIHVCTYVYPACIHVCTYVFMYVRTYICMCCMYVCTCVRMYVYEGIPQNSIPNAKCPEFLQVIIIRCVTLRTNILTFFPGREKSCTLLGQE